jgi:hypothetical protein
MKIRIGPYKDFIGPYQIAEKLCFWTRKEDKYGSDQYPGWVHTFGEWLAGKDDHETWLSKACNWIYSKRTRTIKVRIDKYDTWSMDSTLAYIIVPMLKQLKDSKHGSVLVDDEDVPEHLRSTTEKAQAAKKEEWDSDGNLHARWDWVMSEMIFAFESKNSDWDTKYYSGKSDVSWKPTTGSDVYEMVKGPNDTLTIDFDGMKAEQDRVSNGFRLFGKYYEGLWD